MQHYHQTAMLKVTPSSAISGLVPWTMTAFSVSLILSYIPARVGLFLLDKLNDISNFSGEGCTGARSLQSMILPFNLLIIPSLVGYVSPGSLGEGGRLFHGF